ncbi:hypothetical protein DFJ58DRAFT_870672 [Suillus subalutaceus]|uniref:uncharacterized protein n=1 Tax=Suillus subalutaceus TaxID=48586 RepID=UPI001B87CF21|nr:uncharacterized protein DFJ58DRAFT_870672 [Suillus subalutaceus]KAG1832342.1 hypothetical protein DFJ58DRAFT_870672 [Suillus subalutaceus]
MHRDLESEDIIYAVLEHVKSSVKDLVNMAMTCSTLAGPTLDILWSEQSSLAPLIMCLPQDTWKVAKDQTIDLYRELAPTEWEHLRMNASRRIFKQFPPATHFPNLCALDFEAIFGRSKCSSRFLLLRQFMLPGLEVLRFDIPGGVPTYEVEQLLDCSSRRSVRPASTVDIGGPWYHDFYSSPEFQKAVQTIINIQQARCLQTLMLTLCGTSNDAGGMPLELHSLKHLCLFGSSLPQCTHFIRQVATRQLSYISIKYSKPASPTEITAFVESLSTSCQIGSLEQIYVMDTSDDRDPKHAIPLPSEIFRPLLKFSRLSSVKFIGIGNYNLDDRFINDIAVAWPEIWELKFAAMRCASYTVTFTAMISLASRCRSLHTLHLMVDATQSTTIPRAPDGTEELWPMQTALQKLHLGYSEVSEVARCPA